MKRMVCLLLASFFLVGAVAVASEPFGGGQSLSLACLEGWYSAVSMNDNLPVWQEIEKATGVSIKWEANSDYDTAMQPRVAAGQQLPDIMLVPPTWGGTGVYKLATDKMIIPLNELIEEHAPNIKRVLEENPALKGLLTAPDGNIYSIADTPMFVNSMVVQNALFIRQDWLDKLELEVPVTIEDWHNVLTAFKGYADTAFGAPVVPYSGMAGEVGDFLKVFMGAYGLPVGGSEWWYDDDGQVFYVYSSPAFKDFLTEMNKWYAEGLVDMEMTRDEANFQSLVATDVVGAFSHLSERVPQYDGLLATSGATGHHSLVVPPMIGDRPLLTKRPATWSHYGITRDCADPVLAIKWLDFIWGSDEGVTFTEWGIKGQTYDVDSEGRKYYTDFVLKNPDGLDPYNALRSLGISNTVLVRTPAEVYVALNAGSTAIPYAEALLDMRVESFPAMMATVEEQAVVDRIQPDLRTFANESIAKFITAAQSLDEFDAYVATLGSIGLEELRAIKQAQFDRSGMR